MNPEQDSSVTALELNELFARTHVETNTLEGSKGIIGDLVDIANRLYVENMDLRLQLEAQGNRYPDLLLSRTLINDARDFLFAQVPRRIRRSGKPSKIYTAMANMYPNISKQSIFEICDAESDTRLFLNSIAHPTLENDRAIQAFIKRLRDV